VKPVGAAPDLLLEGKDDVEGPQKRFGPPTKRRKASSKIAAARGKRSSLWARVDPRDGSKEGVAEPNEEGDWGNVCESVLEGAAPHVKREASGTTP